MLLFIYFTPTIYNDEYIKRKLHAKYKICEAPFSGCIFNETKEMVTVRYPWNRMEMAPTMTSTPLHISIMKEISNMTEVMERIP